MCGGVQVDSRWTTAAHRDLRPDPTGLQIEFHVNADGKTNDVELEIDASGEVHVYILVSDAEIIMNREVPPPLLPTTMPIIKRHLMRMSRILQEQA